MTAATEKPRIDAKDVLSRISITEVVGEVVQLRKRGAEFVGLCPFHAEKTPSFTVVPKKGFCKCFGCGKGGDAIEFLKNLHGIGYREALEQLAARVGLMPRDGVTVKPRKPLPPPDDRKQEEHRRKAVGWCRDIWEQGQPARHTVVEQYLAGRGIDADIVEIPATLRFHRSLLHSDTGRNFAAMIGAIHNKSGHLIGLHRTFLENVWAKQQPETAAVLREVTGCALDDVWRKAAVESPKKMLGRHQGGAVRLAPAASMLALAEGIETGLSVMQSTGMATWAALSLSNMGSVELPDIVEEVVLCGDSDMKDMDMGRRTIERAAANYQLQGRRVRIAWAAEGMDFNDMLLARYKAG